MEERKTFSRYSLIFKAIAVMLVMTLMANFTLTAYAAEGEKKYVREVIVVTADTLKAAQDKADEATAATVDENDPGKYRKYTVFETPIYSSTKVKTWLCYATTTNPNLAVTSIKAMNMRGGWSYEEYDKFLDEVREKAELLVDDMLTAVREYNENLAANTERAVYAKGIFDMLYEDDSKKTVSEFFKDMGTESYGENSKEEAACREKMTNFLMQANVDLVCSIQNALMLACADTYARKKNIGPGNNYFEGLEHPVFLKMIDESDDYHEFDNYVDDLLNSLPEMQEDLRFYTKNQFKFTETMEAMMDDLSDLATMLAEDEGKTEEEIQATHTEDVKQLAKDLAEGKIDIDLSAADLKTVKAINDYNTYFDGLEVEDKERYTTGRTLYAAFTECEYTGYKIKNSTERQYQNLYELMTYHNLNHVNTEKDSYKRSDIYPLILLMSPGQRAMLKTGFTQFVTSVATSTEILNFNKELTLKRLNATREDGEEEIKLTDTVSVYYNVDRSLYEKDSGIALTDDAVLKTKQFPLSPEQAAHQKAYKIAKCVAIASGATAAILTGAVLGMALKMHLAFQAANLSGGPITMFGVSLNNIIMEGSVTQLLRSTVLQRTLANLGTESIETYTGCFGRSLGAFICAGSIGTILTVLNVITIAAFIISMIITFSNLRDAERANAPYIDIPRVMCNHEQLFDEKADGGKSEEWDYIYYYGVKNPLLTQQDQARASETKDVDGNTTTDILKYGIGDIANWTLTGASREWVALYAANDPRAGNPIPEGAFMVTSDAGEIGRNGSDGEGFTAVKKFNEGAPYDLQYYYGLTEEDDSIGEVYLGYKMEKSTVPSQGASVFSDISPVGMLVVGAVAGGGFGTLITWFITKKRKKAIDAEG